MINLNQNTAENKIHNNNENITDTKPKQSENRIPLKETDSHRKSIVIKYIVQDGETLQKISKKFSISKELIRSSNGLLDHEHVHPGEILRIYLDAQLLDYLNPVNVLRYNPNENNNHIKGKLMIKDYELIFRPHSMMHHQIKMKLFGHLVAKIVENPNPIFFSNIDNNHHHHNNESDCGTSQESNAQDTSDLAVLSIEYTNEENITATEFFTGNSSDLKEYQRELEKVAEMTKENGEDYDPSKLYEENSTKNIHHIKQKAHHSLISLHPADNTIQPQEHNGNHAPIPIPVPQEEEPLSNIKIDGPFNILSKEDITIFRKQLPKRYRNSDWICLFRTKIHGFSLSTLFHRIAGKAPLILFIRTVEQERIGVFISSGLTISDKYYGNGDTYVFRFQPQIESFHWDYHKLSCNNFFILSSLDSISFGASSKDGIESALFIDKHLSNGYSKACDTFCSPQLTSKESFLIEDLEIWYVGITPELI